MIHIVGTLGLVARPACALVVSAHAAQIDILLASYELIYLPIPVLEPLVGMGHKAGRVRESRFELPEPAAVGLLPRRCLASALA